MMTMPIRGIRKGMSWAMGDAQVIGDDGLSGHEDLDARRGILDDLQQCRVEEGFDVLVLGPDDDGDGRQGAVF